MNPAHHDELLTYQANIRSNPSTAKCSPRQRSDRSQKCREAWSKLSWRRPWRTSRLPSLFSRWLRKCDQIHCKVVSCVTSSFSVLYSFLFSCFNFTSPHHFGADSSIFNTVHTGKTEEIEWGSCFLLFSAHAPCGLPVCMNLFDSEGPLWPGSRK